MKHLLIAAALLIVVGCGEELEVVEAYNYDGAASSIVVTGDSSEKLNDSIGFKVTEYLHATLLRVDTAFHSEMIIVEMGESWWTDRRVESFNVTARYEIDSTTYDTICYERKECEL